MKVEASPAAAAAATVDSPTSVLEDDEVIYL
jgi:hypothetical protein